MRLSKKAVTSLAPPFTPAQTLRLRRRRPSFREGPVRCKELLRPNGLSCSENLPKAIPHNYQARHEFSPFSCPIFLGHPEARGRCSQGERVLCGRDLCRSGGTGKQKTRSCRTQELAEAVPRKMRGRKRLAY